MMRIPVVLDIGTLVLAAACASDAPMTDETGETSRPSMPWTGSLERPHDRPWLGEVLLTESFDDGNLEARGWYDRDPAPRFSTTVHAPGSSASFECRYARGATECTGGTPGRRLFDGVEEVYVSYWVRYSDDWVGSGRPYHPHELYLMTTLEDRWAGPSYTHLTLYIENIELHGQLALQDGANVDNRCILRNDDATIGCNGGALAAFAFGENRSVAACNGLTGPVQFRDCYALGDGRWSSSRAWREERAGLAPATGSGGWHFVETYIRLNRIVDGRGVPDGALRYAIDGVTTIAVDSVLLRTGRHPDMRINQLLLAPYIGDGSPVDQTMWLDELTIARGRRP